MHLRLIKPGDQRPDDRAERARTAREILQIVRECDPATLEPIALQSLRRDALELVQELTSALAGRRIDEGLCWCVQCANHAAIDSGARLCPSCEEREP